MDTQEAKRRSFSERTTPKHTESMNFTKEDMGKLYTKFARGPATPSELYDVTIEAGYGAGGKSVLSRRAFEDQLFSRRPNGEVKVEQKRLRDGFAEFKNVAGHDVDWDRNFTSIRDMDTRLACHNLPLMRMAVNTDSSDDSIYCEFNKSSSSSNAGERVTMLTVFSAMAKTQSNGSMELTSTDSMEQATTETMNMI